MPLVNDPLDAGGIQQFIKDFRSGKTSSEEVTTAYLNRIEALNPKLQAFEYIDADHAIATAKAMDLLIKSNVDLGPLMGVPIAIKDIFNISGMPVTKAGSNLSLPITNGSEGSFIQALRRSGCVFLGLTKAVELCLGITGISSPRGTPWNASDMDNHRLPGGSSSGSGVATAAGMCALSIGSDSGGSVRVPAAFNGVFGLKTTFGLWPTDGVFPLDAKVDSIGLLTKSARDALIAFDSICNSLFGTSYVPKNSGVALNRLHIGIPKNHFLDNIHPSVKKAFDQVNNMLTRHGSQLDDIYVPQATERADYFPISMPSSLIALLGQDFFLTNQHLMDKTIARRVETGLHHKAFNYIALENKRKNSCQEVDKQFIGFDTWVSPTTTVLPPLLSELEDAEVAFNMALGMTQNTQPANYLGLCAASIPIPNQHTLPIGYQLMGAANTDRKLLEIAILIESMLGTFQ